MTFLMCTNSTWSECDSPVDFIVCWTVKAPQPAGVNMWKSAAVVMKTATADGGLSPNSDQGAILKCWLNTSFTLMWGFLWQSLKTVSVRDLTSNKVVITDGYVCSPMEIWSSWVLFTFIKLTVEAERSGDQRSPVKMGVRIESETSDIHRSLTGRSGFHIISCLLLSQWIGGFMYLCHHCGCSWEGPPASLSKSAQSSQPNKERNNCKCVPLNACTRWKNFGRYRNILLFVPVRACAFHCRPWRKRGEAWLGKGQSRGVIWVVLKLRPKSGMGPVKAHRRKHLATLL